MKAIFIGVATWILGQMAMDYFKRGQAVPGASNSETNNTTANSAAASSGQTGGAGGASYSETDMSGLAAAVDRLTEGVRLPNIRSQSYDATGATSVELIAGEAGKRICVLAYAVSGPGSNDAAFRSGSQTTNLWKVDLDVPVGNSGANLATAWPGFLFATNPGEDLTIAVTAACSVSVTYWMEAA